MRIIWIGTIAVAGMLLLFAGCSKTSVDKLTGVTNPCDTTTVGYTKDIFPILQQFCYSCHGNGNTVFSDGVNLEGTDSGYMEVSNWANGGYVVGNVTYSPGYNGMPYGKPKLSDCEIDKIIAWVNRKYPH
jgi:hypothetical protein